MQFHYNGKYNGDSESLPTREHEDGYVPFKEPSANRLMLIINLIAIIVTVILIIPAAISMKHTLGKIDYFTIMAICLAAAIESFVIIFPHEFLHALCFKSDVYMYTYISHGACFVVGPELMSKTRFILMCMLPNLVFGFLPYILWIIFPTLWYLGMWGALAIGMGGGDYMNVVNCLFQVPNGAKTYMHGMNSFWVKTDKEI